MPVVNYNAVLNQDAKIVWAVLKQFGQISKWHPAIPASEIEGGLGDGLVGCVRRLTLQDGAVLREKLVMIDDGRRSLSYCILESPLPLDNYVATVTLVPITDQSSTLVQWSASFELQDTDPQRSHVATVRDLIVGGHESLQIHLNGAAAE